MCSCLSWPAMMPRRPHRPLILPPLAQGIPLLTHTPCYSTATAASRRSRTSEPSYSSPRGLPLLRLPRLRVVPFLGLPVVQTTALVLSARRGQCGQRHSIGRVLYMERLTAGSTATTQFFVICQVSRFVRPVGLQIFQEEESFIRLAEKMAYQ